MGMGRTRGTIWRKLLEGREEKGRVRTVGLLR
jgi:hypothetical protein